ncbi:MAG: hypothetical protein GXP62_20295 [Oligoflexia bacterium]|nr:hypothetical protein [Oligoflexia bacterium]
MSETTFHRRAWARTITEGRSLARRARRLAAETPLNPDAAWDLRSLLGNLLAVLEHASNVNGPLALGRDTPALAPPDSSTDGVDPDMTMTGATLQTRLASVLDKLLTGLDGAPEHPSSDGLVSIRVDVLPTAAEALDLAVLLHRRLDPIQALDDDHAALLATPLAEHVHIKARQLKICPTCGTGLTELDRTVDGSYCEGCRTRWTAAG